MSLAIHKLIDEHQLDTFEKVKNFFSQEPFHFKVSEDAEKNLYLLKYDQFKTDFKEKAAHEARGIILCKDTNRVVCYPFNKFFNAGEKHASEIDWESAIVHHKYDGSIIKLYYHDDKWHVATNGTTDAKKAESFGGKTLFELFQEASSDHNLDYDKLDKECTYMFELMHPEHLIVIRYQKPKIIHIGTRHNITYEESYDHIGIEQAEHFLLKTLEDCQNEAIKLGAAQEGYVIRDKHWNRIKVKGPTYVKLHHTLTNNHLTEEEVAAQMILKGEEDEVKAYDHDERIADICHHIDEIRQCFDQTLETMIKHWKEIYDAKTPRKDLVQAFKKKPTKYFPFFMFRCNYEAKKKDGETEEPLIHFFRTEVIKKFTKDKVTRADARLFLTFLKLPKQNDNTQNKTSNTQTTNN